MLQAGLEDDELLNVCLYLILELEPHEKMLICAQAGEHKLSLFWRKAQRTGCAINATVAKHFDIRDSSLRHRYQPGQFREPSVRNVVIGAAFDGYPSAQSVRNRSFGHVSAAESP